MGARRALALAVVMLLASAACSKPGPHPRRSPTPTPTPSVSAIASGGTTSPTPKSSASPSKTRTASPSPSSSTTASPIPSYVQGTEHAPLTVTMGHSCVTRNSIQTMTVRSTPKLQYSWGTTWPDREAHSEFAGAYGVGVIPDSGSETKTWVIPATAPLGQAETQVLVAGKINGKSATAISKAFWSIRNSC